MSENEKKELLKQAWKEIFEVEEVTDDADFFEDGGDSIKAVQLSSWLLQKGIKLDLGKVFYTPVLSQMAENLEETEPVFVPEEMVTKELIGSKLGDIMKNLDSGKAADEKQNEQICDPQAMPQKGAGQLNEQICDPQAMPQKGAGQPNEQICDPQAMPMPQKGAGQLNDQICDPQAMPQKGAGQLNEQICDPKAMPQKGAGQLNDQICDPQAMPAQNMPVGYPYPAYDQDFGMMTAMFQTILQQQQVMLQMMQVMLTRTARPFPAYFPAPFQRKAPNPFPMKAAKPFSAQKPAAMLNQIPDAAKQELQKQMAQYQSHPVDKPIEKPNVIGIKPAKVTKPEYSAEEVLDHVLSGIFKNGYSKTEDLFEQGLTSLDTVKMVTRCGEHGYSLSMQDIYMKSTFEELVSCMKAGE